MEDHAKKSAGAAARLREDDEADKRLEKRGRNVKEVTDWICC